jgi:hypothetical protein
MYNLIPVPPMPPIPDALRPDRVTFLAYGSLLSEASARWTFPHLTHFRYARVYGLRRVFGHPHIFLIQQQDEQLLGVSAGMKLASLSAEYCDSEDDDPDQVVERGAILSASSFVVAAFDVTLTDSQRLAFLDREASYDIVTVPFYDINEVVVDDSRTTTATAVPEPLGMGVICLKGNDDKCRDLIQQLSLHHPLVSSFSSVWNWPRDCGLLPATGSGQIQ